MKKTQKGFTLVELLVVIAILAILSTVSVVGYTAFIEKAHQSVAMQEMTQIRNALVAEDIVNNDFNLADGIDDVVAYASTNGASGNFATEAEAIEAFVETLGMNGVFKVENGLCKYSPAGKDATATLNVQTGVITTSKGALPVDEDLQYLEDHPEDFVYIVENGAVTITGYKGNSDHVVIPSEIDGYTVKAIKSGAFTSSPVARAVRRAKNDAPDQNKTFYIPDTIETIEEGSFDENDVFVTNATKKPDGWKDSSLSDGKSGNIFFEAVKEECVIKKDIFYSYSYFQKGYTIVDCFNNSTVIRIPNNINGHPVNFIAFRAFKNCTNLEKIYFPKDLSYIYGEAFMDCTSLKEVIFEDSTLYAINNGTFRGCTSLEKVVLPESLVVIYKSAFQDCGSITEMTMPATVASIHDDAFLNTTIQHINFGSTQERFESIEMNNNEEMLVNAPKTYTPQIELNGITEIKDLNKLSPGTLVTARGYVAHYLSGGDRFLLVDEANRHGIVVYMPKNKYSDVMPAVGDYVEISSELIYYSSMPELSNVTSIQKIGEKHIAPEQITLHQLSSNTTKYLYKYIEVELVVASPAPTSNKTFFEGLDIYYYTKLTNNLLKVGDTVLFRGTVINYATIQELETDISNVEILNRTVPLNDVSISDIPSLEEGTYVRFNGYVATYLNKGNSFLLVDKDNQNGIIVSYSQSYYPERPAVGDYIEIIGDVDVSNGAVLISKVEQVKKLGQGTIVPQKVTAAELSANPQQYLNLYIEIELTVKSSTGATVRFEEIGYKAAVSLSEELYVGHKVVIKCAFALYSNQYQLQTVTENVQIKE